MQLLGGLPLGMTAVIFTLSQPLIEQKANCSLSLWAFTFRKSRLQYTQWRFWHYTLHRILCNQRKTHILKCIFILANVKIHRWRFIGHGVNISWIYLYGRALNSPRTETTGGHISYLWIPYLIIIHYYLWQKKPCTYNRDCIITTVLYHEIRCWSHDYDIIFLFDVVDEKKFAYMVLNLRY